MDIQTLHTTYLNEGTAGYAIVRKFFSRYADVLAAANIIDTNDVLHEVFLSLSKTNFDNVYQIDHYIHRAIKLQCWSLLDKAIKQKAIIAANENTVDENEKFLERSFPSAQNEHLREIEGNELLVQINLFKQHLKNHEVGLLNLLIDETERSDIAAQLGMNLNTLDTNIRRLRMKLADYLSDLGYVHSGMNRFS